MGLCKNYCHVISCRHRRAHDLSSFANNTLRWRDVCELGFTLHGGIWNVDLALRLMVLACRDNKLYRWVLSDMMWSCYSSQAPRRWRYLLHPGLSQLTCSLPFFVVCSARSIAYTWSCTGAFGLCWGQRVPVQARCDQAKRRWPSDDVITSWLAFCYARNCLSRSERTEHAYTPTVGTLEWAAVKCIAQWAFNDFMSALRRRCSQMGNLTANMHFAIFTKPRCRYNLNGIITC